MQGRIASRLDYTPNSPTAIIPTASLCSRQQISGKCGAVYSVSAPENRLWLPTYTNDMHEMPLTTYSLMSDEAQASQRASDAIYIYICSPTLI